MKNIWQKFLLRAETLLLVLTGWFLRRTSAPRSGVLLVRWDRIGDAVLWLPYAADLITAAESEGRPVTLLCSDAMADFYHRLFPSVEILPFQVRNGLQNRTCRKAFLKQIRTRKFAALYNPRSAREFLVDDAIAAAAACPEAHAVLCPGREVNPSWQWWSRPCYTHLVPVSAGASEWEIAGAFHAAVCGLHRGDPGIYQALRAMPRPAITGNYLVLLPGSCDPFRCWPKDHYRQLAATLHTRYPDLTVIIAGSSGEGFPAGNGAVDWTGRTTLPEFVGLLAGAQCVIGNESGGIHLAAAMGVPSYCLAGGGHWGRFVPYPEPCPFPGVRPPVLLTAPPCPWAPCNWKCRYFSATSDRCPCIDRIPLENVEAIKIELPSPSHAAAHCSRA